MTDAVPPHPNFYLKQAQTHAHTVRSWIHRTVPVSPDPHGDDVVFAMDVFDELDRLIAAAVQSADHHLPNTATNVEKQRRDERARSDFHRHQLEAADSDWRALNEWAFKVRWSPMPGQVSADELDHLDNLIRNLREHITHLIAAVQDEELAR